MNHWTGRGRERARAEFGFEPPGDLMRVVFDLNILLDLLLRRAPHYENALAVHARVEDRQIVGIVGANTVVALSHLLGRALGPEHATAALKRVLASYEIRSIGRAALEEALTSTSGEYDDAVLYAAARHGRADALVTRKPGNFADGPVMVLTPRELLAQAAGASRHLTPRRPVPPSPPRPP